LDNWLMGGRVRRSKPRYEIIYLPPADSAPVVVHSTLNADEATLLFATELQRLLSDRAKGELAIHRKASSNAKPDVIVRQVVTSSSP
jgi:hypothetical protein